MQGLSNVEIAETVSFGDTRVSEIKKQLIAER